MTVGIINVKREREKTYVRDKRDRNLDNYVGASVVTVVCFSTHVLYVCIYNCA